MNIFLKKIVVAAINNQWLKGAKDLILEYANKTFLELMYWLYIHYRHKISHVTLLNGISVS